MKNPKKTSYCYHSFNCDKEIDCWKGEDCPYFVFNPDYIDQSQYILEKHLIENSEKEFDDIWKGL